MASRLSRCHLAQNQTNKFPHTTFNLHKAHRDGPPLAADSSSATSTSTHQARPEDTQAPSVKRQATRCYQVPSPHYWLLARGLACECELSWLLPPITKAHFRDQRVGYPVHRKHGTTIAQTTTEDTRRRTAVESKRSTQVHKSLRETGPRPGQPGLCAILDGLERPS